MPDRQIDKRGGAPRYRTVKTKDGRVLQVAVVRKARPRGAQAAAGEPKGK
jgi:hypothetical protein